MASDETEPTQQLNNEEWGVERRTSYIGLLLHTTKGKAILAMGVLHTLIVSGCLTAAYFFTGLNTTLGLTVVYGIAVTINTYVNNKENQLTLKTTLVFIVVIPLVITLLLITGYEFIV